MRRFFLLPPCGAGWFRFVHGRQLGNFGHLLCGLATTYGSCCDTGDADRGDANSGDADPGVHGRQLGNFSRSGNFCHLLCDLATTYGSCCDSGDADSGDADRGDADSGDADRGGANSSAFIIATAGGISDMDCVSSTISTSSTIGDIGSFPVHILDIVFHIMKIKRRTKS